MAKLKPRHHVHLIEWRDAYSLGTWTKPDDMRPEPVVVQSVGFLIDDAVPGHLTLACSDDGQGHVADGIHIPRDMIVRKVRLT